MQVGAILHLSKLDYLQSLGLVFVAVYQSALKLTYVDGLLARVKEVFADNYHPKSYDYITFESSFKRELDKAEQRAASSRQQPLPQSRQQVKTPCHRSQFCDTEAIRRCREDLLPPLVVGN